MCMFNKLLRMSNTTLMVAVTFFANLYFYNHIGTLYLQTRGLSLGQIGSLGSILIVSSLLAEIPTGILADKIGRKWSVVIALFIQTAGEYLYLFTNNYWGFALISALAGIGFAFASGAGEALLYDSLPKGDSHALMKKATRLNASVYLICSLIAPLIGGIIVSTLTLSKFKVAILFTAISVTMAFLLSLFFKEPKRDFKHIELSPREIFSNGLTYLLSNKQLQWIVAILILTDSFTGMLLSLYQPYFVVFSVTPLWIGWSLSLASLLAFLIMSQLPKFEKWLGERKAFYLMCIFPSLGYLALATFNNQIAVIMIFIITYASTFTRGPTISALINKQLDKKSRATTLSMIAILDKLYIGVMSVVFGIMAQHSFRITFLVMGILIFGFSVILRVNKYAHSSI